MIMQRMHAILWVWLGLLLADGHGSVNVYLTETPDYSWWAGCFGTASGNLMGYWDRHGMADFYTGQTVGGVAPLSNGGDNAGIIALWSSQAGVDGRSTNVLGHYDDYYNGYQDTGPDPYVLAGRPEHNPDCLCDFLGISQRKWTNMDGECDGNIDGFSFVYWDHTGNKRVNFVPPSDAGLPARDIQSGLRAWTQYRGYDCEVFTQLADFNPETPAGMGFSFADLKAEIDAGYPVLLFLQKPNDPSRTVNGQANVNPEIHGMLAYGYYLADDGTPFVRYRTSWASGPDRLKSWDAGTWEGLELPLRGVIGYHPLPKVRQCSLDSGNLTLRWDAPAAELYDSTQGGTRLVHAYVVEMADSLSAGNFQAVSPVIQTNTYTMTNCPVPAYFRLRLTPP